MSVHSLDDGNTTRVQAESGRPGTGAFSEKVLCLSHFPPVPPAPAADFIKGLLPAGVMFIFRAVFSASSSWVECANSAN